MSCESIRLQKSIGSIRIDKTFEIKSSPVQIEEKATLIIEFIVAETSNFPLILSEARFHDMLNLVWDMICNSANHGNENIESKLVVVKISLGENGYFFSISDEGYFYSRPEVKIMIESRMPIEPDWNDGKEHGGLGMKMLRDFPDEVLVDTAENTLCFCFRKERDTAC